MKKNVFYLVILWLFTSLGFAQFSKTHYIPPLTFAGNSGITIGEQYLYISTPSTVPVNFVIKQIGNATISGTVTRDNPYEFYINSSSSPNQFVTDFANINSVQTNKGYIIEAGDLIYASIRVTSGDQQQNQAGELVSKGLAALGTSFINPPIPAISPWSEPSCDWARVSEGASTSAHTRTYFISSIIPHTKQ